MYPISIDTETELITPGNLAPRLVCVSVARPGHATTLYHHADPGLRPLLSTWLTGNVNLIVGHNLAYDLAVLCAYGLSSEVFAAVSAGRVECTQTTEMLLQICTQGWVKRPSLAALTAQYLEADARKLEEGEGGEWRLRYGELRDVPLAEWPPEAKAYALRDAEATLAVWQAQREACRREVLVQVPGGQPKLRPAVVPPEMRRQARAAFALHLCGVRGLAVDAEATAALRARLEARRDADHKELTQAGLLRENGSKDMAKIRSLLPPGTAKTPTGKPKTDKATLLSSGNDLLAKLASRETVAKTLQFVDVLDRARDSGSLHPRWNVLKATGRTSCGDAKEGEPGNLQNQPREGGVRECFVPRAGFVFVSCDYKAAELVALAQVCVTLFGKSRMADAIREGRDLHQELADQLDWLDRQGAKAINFGKPGGLGPASLVEYAKATYGAQLTLEQANQAIAAFERQWPEMGQYFRAMARMVATGEARVEQLGSLRLRGGCRYTTACNTFFQGLVADAAKQALWDVWASTETGGPPVYPVAFIHDEILAEVPEERAEECASHLAKVMKAALDTWCPDVPCSTEWKTMKRWEK